MTGSSEKEGDGSEANLGETVPIGAKNDVAEGRKTMPIKVKSIGTKMMKERNDRDRMKGPIGTGGRWRLGCLLLFILSFFCLLLVLTETAKKKDIFFLALTGTRRKNIYWLLRAFLC